jgi:hypothetical protein
MQQGVAVVTVVAHAASLGCVVGGGVVGWVVVDCGATMPAWIGVPVLQSMASPWIHAQQHPFGQPPLAAVELVLGAWTETTL